MREIGLVIIGFLLTFTSFSQSMEEQVRAMFDNPSEVQWIEHYKGRLSDINDVAITLGYDGRTCYGKMWYLRSKTSFKLEGQIIGDTTLKLIEYDSLGLATGRVEGTIKEYDGIVGNWFTLDRTLGEDMELLPTTGEPRYPGYCGDNKWVHKYLGMIGNDEVEMILRRANNGYVKGTVYYKMENKTYLAEGDIVNNGRLIQLEIKDVNWKVKATITAKVDFSSDRISGKVMIYGEEKTCDLPLTEKLSVACVEYADFLTKTEITYPKTKNQDFNEHIQYQINDWLALSRAYTAEYKSKLSLLTASQRSSLRSYCWYEVDCFSNRLISGKIIQTNTWNDKYEGFAFNYDLLENKEITLETLFNEGFDYQRFIKQHIDNDVRRRPFYNDGYYSVWITTQKFEYFTFRKEGMVLSTSFNGIYGEQQVIIPYDVLMPHLRDTSILEMIR